MPNKALHWNFTLLRFVKSRVLGDVRAERALLMQSMHEHSLLKPYSQFKINFLLNFLTLIAI